MHEHLHAIIGFDAECVTGFGDGLQHAGYRGHDFAIGRLDADALAERTGCEHRIASFVQGDHMTGDRRVHHGSGGSSRGFGLGGDSSGSRGGNSWSGSLGFDRRDSGFLIGGRTGQHFSFCSGVR